MPDTALPPQPAADVVLARRLERAESAANAAFVEARARVEPSSGAAWTEVGGAYAMFDGAGSPITQTFGVGLFDRFLDDEFEQIERFFTERGAATTHEIAVFAAPSTWHLLSSRGYAPVESSTVLVRALARPYPGDEPAAGVTVRRVGEDEGALWARVAAEGWSSESAELGPFMENLGMVMARTRSAHCFLAELDGRAVAAGALHVSSGVALLAGASTIATARRRGAQAALLRARLAFAADHGADLAMIVTSPGSASQRNAVRQGFRPVYIRSKWERPLPGGAGR